MLRGDTTGWKRLLETWVLNFNQLIHNKEKLSRKKVAESALLLMIASISNEPRLSFPFLKSFCCF